MAANGLGRIYSGAMTASDCRQPKDASPMTKPIYAIGDIHGQTEQLERALELITMDGGAEAEVVFVGDYVDRGPDSRGVIDRLMQGQADGRNWICLKGNHDRMFTWFMEDFPREDPHLPVELYYLQERIGGAQTLNPVCMRPHARQFLLNIWLGSIRCLCPIRQVSSSLCMQVFARVCH